jgi:hypothetical protein
LVKYFASSGNRVGEFLTIFGVWKTVGGGAGLVMPAKAGIQAQMEASWAASYTISP